MGRVAGISGRGNIFSRCQVIPTVADEERERDFVHGLLFYSVNCSLSAFSMSVEDPRIQGC